MKRLFLALGLLALVAAVMALGLSHKKSRPGPAEPLPYQALASELSAPEQQRLAAVRAQVRVAEEQRVTTLQWPERFLEEPGVTWTRAVHGVYVNYLGIPSDPARLRWLVLVIEPEPAAIRDPPPPPDEEHHLLADGTALHVTLWTGRNEGAVPEVVLPFPAAEGWTQRLVGR